MPDEIPTIKEVAALLRVAEEPVYAPSLVREMPARTMRDQWRFKRTELDQWMDA
ncbi:MAG: helix-turn-helix domain-containing protein, partial [Polyangiaceae bacterium]|nr:helix-turn-helix domain-containing protein [Polyangiaceae bacterium]